MDSTRAPRFGLIGAGGYIARKHFRAIKACGGELAAICDQHEAVGDVEPWFPQAQLYLRENDFWYACGDADYVAVCTPSHLHFAHCRRALWAGCDVVCEKPVTLGLEGLDMLAEECVKARKQIHPVLQLRYEVPVIALLQAPPPDAEIEIRYWSRRGAWYDSTWKADSAKSGGLAFNLGIHGFDVLCQWLGRPMLVGASTVEGPQGILTVKGIVKFGDHPVSFSISRDPQLLGDRRVDRGIFIGGQRFCDLGTGNPGLHDQVYREIVAGRGLRLSDTRACIELCEKIARST